MVGGNKPGAFFNMPITCGEENTEVAAPAEKIEKTSALGIINILTFQARFYLRGVCFNPKFGELIAWFFPQGELVDKVFDVCENIFSMFQDVQYVEGENSVTIKVTEGSLFVSYTGNSFQDNLDDLTGSVAFGVKMNPEKFPQWIKYRNGILKFRLKNGQEYQFLCAK